MSDNDPITFRPAGKAVSQPGVHVTANGRLPVVSFSRYELNQIFSIYGRRVAEGEWRDYAIDMLGDRAVFSVFRHACDQPLYRIEKNPRLARRQGAYCVIAASGGILKRGHSLNRVLGVFDRARLHIVGV
ncbi:MAG: DUF2794 domain-containing protein [Alphaproteobacteria bacterium]